MTEHPWRVAVVGFGSIGRRHCDNLGRLGIARRVVVRRPDSRNPAFSPPGGVRVASSPREALDTGIDLAIVCTPTSLHVDGAMEFVQAGIPVLVEKPLCHRLADGQRLAEAARRRGTVVAVAYCMRFHPAYALAHQLLAGGAVGRVVHANAWFESYLPGWHPWEDYRQSYAARHDLGGGAIRTLDHELDLLNWCLGRPEKVAGYAANSGCLEIDADEHAVVLMEHPGGATSTARLSLCRRDHARGFEFVGTEATLRFRFDTGRLERLAPGVSEVLWEDSQYDLNQMYLAMLAQFLDDLESGQSHLARLDDGLANVAIADAVLARSAFSDLAIPAARPEAEGTPRTP